MDISTHREIAKELTDIHKLSLFNKAVKTQVSKARSQLEDLLIRENNHLKDRCLLRVYYQGQSSTYTSKETFNEADKLTLLEKIRFVSLTLASHYNGDVFVNSIQEKLMKAEERVKND